MKRPANLSIDTKLLEEAKNLDINLSRTLEAALREHIRKIHAQQWLDENKDAFESYDAHVEKRGTFSDKLRSF